MNFNFLIISILSFIFFLIFSLFDSALFNLSPLRAKEIIAENKRGSKTLKIIYHHLNIHKASIIVYKCGLSFSFIINFFCFWFKSSNNQNFFNSVGGIVIFIIILIVFYLLLVEAFIIKLGEICSEKVLLKFGWFLVGFSYLVLFLSIFVFLINKLVIKLLKNKKIPKITQKGLKEEIKQMQNQAILNPDDSKLLLNALDLNYKSVYEVMTPRVDVVAIAIDEEIETIKSLMFEMKYSRIPVYDGDEDKIIGLLKERDFLREYIKANGKFKIKPLLQKPLYCFTTTKLYDLVQTMQESQQHFAVVSDEYGGTAGIVTLEDLLESLVGEIYDEDDEVLEKEDIVKVGDEYFIDSETTLNKICEYFSFTSFPEVRSNTLGGLFFESTKEFPRIGKVIELNVKQNEEEKVIILQVVKMQKRRITKLSLKIE